MTLHIASFNRNLLLFATIFSLSACSHAPRQKTEPVEIEFHADNDIAMATRSIADAIGMGEPLDSTQYDFEGVLTDGLGTPLYTDVQGAPGLWQIEVLTPKMATIRNVNIGDLLPDQLENYIATELNLNATVALEELGREESAEDDELNVKIYNIDNGTLRIETRQASAANGVEGPLMRITLSAY